MWPAGPESEVNPALDHRVVAQRHIQGVAFREARVRCGRFRSDDFRARLEELNFEPAQAYLWLRSSRVGRKTN